MAAVRKASGRADFTTRADTQHVVPDCTVAVDLLSVNGKPRSAPQMSVYTSVAGGTVTLTPEKGVNFTIVVPANIPVKHPAAVKATVGATGTVQGTFYWWDSSLNWNNE